MEALELARLQFAVTAGFHFFFVVLTLGLAPAVAIMETRYVISGKKVFRDMTRFWGQIYVINYALGILTGLIMEFQFGFAWSGVSKFVGNVFGAPLAVETLVAFFLESTFLAMWIFGWHVFGRKTHCLLIWLVTATAYMSAFWIMVANSFMQDPQGYEVRDGVGNLTDFSALHTH
jgi:cytochrome d ubiquinol oxidase subunit I